MKDRKMERRKSEGYKVGEKMRGNGKEEKTEMNNEESRRK